MRQISYRGWQGYTKDPLSNRKDAIIMARNIEAYYHAQGWTHVKCDITYEDTPTGHYAIRSNLRFSVEDA